MLVIRPALGFGMTSAGRLSNEEVVEEDVKTDASVVDVTVSILSKGPQSHWASFWEFKNGKTLVAELTAINNDGTRWQKIRHVLTQTRLSLKGYMKKMKYTKEEQQWCLKTSTQNLKLLCEDNPLNGTQYHLLDNNCQEWLRTLFCGCECSGYEGFGMPKNMFPRTANDRTRHFLDKCETTYKHSEVQGGLKVGKAVASATAHQVGAWTQAEQVMRHYQNFITNYAEGLAYVDKLAEFQEIEACFTTWIAKAFGYNPTGVADAAQYVSNLQNAAETHLRAADAAFDVLESSFAGLAPRSAGFVDDVIMAGGEMPKVPVLARVGQGFNILSIGISFAEAYSAYNDLKNGNDPAMQPCEALVKALENKKTELEKITRTNSLERYYQVLEQQTQKIKKLSGDIDVHHKTHNVSRLSGSSATIGGGVAALAGGPISATVLGLSGGVIGIGSSIRNSFAGYSFRSEMMNTYEIVMEAEREYLKEVCPGAHPLLGKPGVFKFTIPDGRCQIIMNVAYTNGNGERVFKASCDRAWSTVQRWRYNGYIYVEPGARAVQVSFQSRSGVDVKAVNRHDARKPWKYPVENEVFTYNIGDGKAFEYELSGYAKWCYVVEERKLSLSEDEMKMLTPRLSA